MRVQNRTVLIKMVLAFATIVASVWVIIYETAWRGPALFALFAAVLVIKRRFDYTNNFIDIILSKKFPLKSKFGYYSLNYPAYQYVDVYNAVVAEIKKFTAIEKLASAHFENLSTIMNQQFYNEHNRVSNASQHLPWKVSASAEDFLPCDVFWYTSSNSGYNRVGSIGFIVRLKYDQNQKICILEMATDYQQTFEQFKANVEATSRQNSIYRGQLISIAFNKEMGEDYGETMERETISLQFLQQQTVADHDIVLSDHIKATIQRNVIDFFQHGELLRSNNLPTSRGLLFYGPPGTGKTFTSKYIYGKLSGVTAIVATGQSLVHIKSICNIARFVQPAMIILEDVDLVFSARQTNLYGTALGDLMDQLDGFAPKDHIVFILTTNDIERLEAAIKDRPGRISQCIFFGLPNRELRERYLFKLLEGYNTAALDIAALASALDGASQAFLSELVKLTCQISLEDQGYAAGAVVVLQQSHFERALKAMTQDNNTHSHSILGLQKQIL